MKTTSNKGQTMEKTLKYFDNDGIWFINLKNFKAIHFKLDLLENDSEIVLSVIIGLENALHLKSVMITTRALKYDSTSFSAIFERNRIKLTDLFITLLNAKDTINEALKATLLTLKTEEIR
ncbi:hypothetical protein [Helicobacter sp.]|uniref:hypothetical protein n=1 Tax=Helicobacter sp. TaxID=218 RepID=UPI0025C6B35A|nr:hypothetical protein [Helicobacter sp.]MCI5968580.1 hypothetical protein [Helicobacter sp.]